MKRRKIRQTKAYKEKWIKKTTKIQIKINTERKKTKKKDRMKKSNGGEEKEKRHTKTYREKKETKQSKNI